MTNRFQPNGNDRQPPAPSARLLRYALRPYLNLAALRSLAASGEDLHAALRSQTPPPEVRALLQALAAVLQPPDRTQIRSPGALAGLLMVEMGYLDQEQLRVVCLDTACRVQRIVTLYQGSVHSSLVRVGEVYKEPLRLNSTSIIVCHNHPSGQLDPSPEDVAVTQQIVEAGRLLDVECLDHLIIGRGGYVSMRERGLGFNKW